MAEKKNKTPKRYTDKVDGRFAGKSLNWVKELDKLLQGSPASLGLSDQQIFDVVNSRLPHEKRISYHTFASLKREDNKDNIANKATWTEEQKQFVADTLRMARAVKTMELIDLSIQKTNKNSIGAHRIVQAMNPQLQTQQHQLGEGSTILNITVGNPEQRDLIRELLGEKQTIDIAHEEVDDKKKLN